VDNKSKDVYPVGKDHRLWQIWSHRKSNETVYVTGVKDVFTIGGWITVIEFIGSVPSYVGVNGADIKFELESTEFDKSYWRRNN